MVAWCNTVATTDRSKMAVSDLISKDGRWNLDDGYNVVLADPPWDYGEHQLYSPKFSGRDPRLNPGNSIHHYPSMSMSEMEEMRVRELCCDQCVLFMWATGPKIGDAIKLGTAWGFKFINVAYVWNKERPLPGAYTITQCEFVLVFRPKKGVLPKRYKTNSRQYFSEKRTQHSRKPEYVQDELDAIYSDARKLELFARRSRDGWDVWGNETDKFDKED
jgi:N6-adenosine-specific RNA methylase IME4